MLYIRLWVNDRPKFLLLFYTLFYFCACQNSDTIRCAGAYVSCIGQSTAVRKPRQLSGNTAFVIFCVLTI